MRSRSNKKSTGQEDHKMSERWSLVLIPKTSIEDMIIG